MCRTLDVNSSGYYRWLKAEPCLRTHRLARIRTSVKQIYDESQGIYGSYKIADRLRKDDFLEAACRNTVATAMREMSLKSKVSKKFTQTTTVSDPAKVAAPNVLNLSFKTDAPNRKWVTDITFLPTAPGILQLAPLLAPGSFRKKQSESKPVTLGKIDGTTTGNVAKPQTGENPTKKGSFSTFENEPLKRPRRDLNPQPPDRQSGALTN
jgi:hypothetical protein